MSEPYTPTTDEIRAVWREWNGYGGLTYRTTPEPSRREMQQEFDTWLDQVKAVARREGQAEAWDAGYASGAVDMDRLRAGDLKVLDITSNPYRTGADQ